MKQVRSLAKIVGLAPVVVGLTATPAARAAVGTNASHRAKSVVPGGERARTPATGCTGTYEFYLVRSGNIKGHGWYTPDGSLICIGTVVVSLYYNKTFSKKATLDITSIYSARYLKTHEVHGDAGKWAHTSFGVHEEFYAPVSICATSQYGGTHRACVSGISQA